MAEQKLPLGGQTGGEVMVGFSKHRKADLFSQIPLQKELPLAYPHGCWLLSPMAHLPSERIIHVTVSVPLSTVAAFRKQKPGILHFSKFPGLL